MDQKKLLEMWGYPQEEVTPLVQKPTPVVSAPMAPAPEMTTQVFEPPAMPTEANEMNPQVKDYLMQKFNLGEFSEDARKQITEENARPDYGNRGMAALAAIGAGMMGRDPTAAGNAILERQKQQGRQKLEDFDKNRANKIQQYTLDRELKKDSREDDLFKRESDTESQESKLADSLAREMGYTGGPITATQFKSFSPVMAKKYEIAEKKLDRKEARDERRFQSGIKLDEKNQKLSTPYGLANSEDDAKKLKDAYEQKSNFDSKIKELIKLREDHKGGAIFNREDVGRGQQLSKDLLLAYKDMAKLGVLSVADEKILNAIIPPDPLQFNSPMAALQGQDPTLHKLKKFQEDSDKDFNTRVQTRTRNGKPQPIGKETENNEVERLDKKTGKTAIFDANTKQFLRFK